MNNKLKLLVASIALAAAGTAMAAPAIATGNVNVQAQIAKTTPILTLRLWKEGKSDVSGNTVDLGSTVISSNDSTYWGLKTKNTAYSNLNYSDFNNKYAIEIADAESKGIFNSIIITETSPQVGWEPNPGSGVASYML